MNVTTGQFNGKHHDGFIRIFRFRGGAELWVGRRWCIVEWRNA